MNKKLLEELTVKKESKYGQVVSIRVKPSVYEALKKKGVDIPKTINNLLERLAE
jgi:hypothetical protein